LIGRGYTGHEHFFEVNLIHMNGRMYDANLGRFLSPDNYIQDPFNTQSYNRYGYVLNNPLKYVDPSGEFLKFLVQVVVIILVVVIVVWAIAAPFLVYGAVVATGGFSVAAGVAAFVATAAASYVVADFLVTGLNKFAEDFETKDVADIIKEQNNKKSAKNIDENEKKTENIYRSKNEFFDFDLPINDTYIETFSLQHKVIKNNEN